MFLFLTVVQAIVAAALVGVILMQRSEGGGLGIGGSPAGMLSARGAADFLTRSTRWLAITFVVLSIALAAIAVSSSDTSGVESTLDRTVAPAAPVDPLGAATTGEATPASGDAAPAETADPLSDATE
ncbi:preprotein translocase subunit SecG [Erythrobacter mangrovi]|uniref:Protein-export membrane protein SecG n=1 Tax=Erythrobacter mangrovi TaxID=2739433 RepID=A0A7D3XA84_9SPHN|nr:preprotein translocase subunit SecG [Erythrobacter mangrovi]QKG71635.1 preprotein translocase subunit SecG [Erythrobacter mangrovi]